MRPGALSIAGLIALTVVMFLDSKPLAQSTPQRDDARETVEDYWAADPDKRYALLSESYKKQLRRQGVKGPKDFGSLFGDHERVWRKRTYQEIRKTGSEAVQIQMLLEWEQTGYTGITTFYFELVKQRGAWRIDNIVH